MSGPDSFMPLYIGDYLADTAHLSPAEHGAYLLLMMHYWRTSTPLLDDDVLLCRISRMSPQEWKRSAKTLRAFFRPIVMDGDNVLTHKRIEKELTEANKRYDDKKAASDAGVAAKRAKRDAKLASLVEPSVKPTVEPMVQPEAPVTPNQNGVSGTTQPQPQPQSNPNGLENGLSPRERAETLLPRICEILRINLEDDPSRITWKRQVEEALRDGLTETELIRATEVARTNGIVKFPYIRSVALKLPKPESKPNGRSESPKRSSTDSHLAGIAMLIDERRARNERGGT